MRVRFLDGSLSRQGADRVLQGADVLRPGEEYVVLEILGENHSRNFLRLESVSGEIAGLFDAEYFQVSDSRLSSYWRIAVERDGAITLSPDEWLKEGFWERLLDGDQNAFDAYNKFRDLLFSEFE